MFGSRSGQRIAVLAVAVGALIVAAAPGAAAEVPDRCLLVPVPLPNLSWQVDGYCHHDAPIREFRTVVTCGDGELAHGNWVSKGLHSVASCPRLIDKRFPKSMDIESR